MITVTIFINGNSIFTRSARNKIQQNKKGETMYKCDDGTIIFHKRKNGAVKLAKKMLDTIREI